MRSSRARLLVDDFGTAFAFYRDPGANPLELFEQIRTERE